MFVAGWAQAQATLAVLIGHAVSAPHSCLLRPRVEGGKVQEKQRNENTTSKGNICDGLICPVYKS